MDVTPQFSFYNIDKLAPHLEAGDTIITPNHRLARAIKQAWAQRQSSGGLGSWATPQVFSLQHWWLHCYEEACLQGEELPLLLNQLQEAELWQLVIQSHPDSAALLRPRGAANLAREAWHSLLLWKQDWHEAGLAQEFKFDPDGSLFLQWASDFESRLAQASLASLPQIAPKLAEFHSVETLVLVEVDELAPLYVELLEEQAGRIERVQSADVSADCRLLACDDAESEMLAAASWAAAQQRQDPGRRVGILLPNLQQQRFTMERALRRAFDLPAQQAAGADSATRLLPVNFSAGVPLASCGPIRTALDLLGLLQRELFLPDLAKLLHSRYRDLAELEQEQVLLMRLYRYGRDRVPESRLRRECERVEVDGEPGLTLGRCLVSLKQSREMKRKQPCSAWRPLFEQILETLGWPGEGPLDSLEYQQVEQWQQVLEQLQHFDLVCDALDYSEALERLGLLCEQAVFQPQTDDASIQVLGLLEAAGLEFDALWLCGVGASNWPPSPEPNPFIPDQLQKRLSMPHASAERELQYARSLLAQYQRSASTLVASYPQLQDSVEQRPSALLDDFDAWETDMPDSQLPPEWLAAQTAPTREWFTDRQAPALALASQQALSGGSGLIADQSQCPFRAFAYHRLDARPLPELAQGMTAAERGALLHDALFQLWERLRNSSELASLSASERSEVVGEAVRLAIEAFYIRDNQALGRALLEVEQARLQTLLERWLEVELERETFEVLAREQDCELEVGPLTLKLRVDRVDRLEDGRELIIDYKSGRGEIREWLGERPKSPQLPLYAQLAGPELSGLGFAIINRRTTELKGLGDRGMAPGIRADLDKVTEKEELPLQDWSSLRDHWHRVLTRLAEEFVAGHAEVDPVDRRNTCTYCGLESLCRVE